MYLLVIGEYCVSAYYRDVLGNTTTVPSPFWLSLQRLFDSFVTHHSLVRAKGEVLVLLCFCLFLFFSVRSTISRQPAGRFTPMFACGRTLVPNASSPLLGVSGPRRAEKGGNEIFVTMAVNGEFLHFGGF